MNNENKNIQEAKKSLKHHIKFFKALIKHINSNDDVIQGRALWAAWCLHRYINDGLIDDIENAIVDHIASNDPQLKE